MSTKWDKPTEERFKREWRANKSIKLLAQEYGRSPRGIHYAAERLGLSPRYDGRRSKGKRFGMYLSRPMLDAVQRRANEKGVNKSDYIRSLIERDIGYITKGDKPCP